MKIIIGAEFWINGKTQINKKGFEVEKYKKIQCRWYG